MNKMAIFIGVIIGLVFGAIFTGLAFKYAAPHILFKEIGVNYSFDKTVELITTRLNAQKGWHVTNVIDQQKEIIDNGGVDVGKVKIIKFCNGELSGEMLSDDDRKFMSVKMPLSIAVYEKSDGRVIINLANGYVMSRLFSGRSEGEIMQRVVKDMESVLSFIHFRYTIF